MLPRFCARSYTQRQIKCLSRFRNEEESESEKERKKMKRERREMDWGKRINCGGTITDDIVGIKDRKRKEGKKKEGRE